MNKDSWIKTGKFLPAFLRDFHDQKDFFKCLFGLWVIPHRKKLEEKREFDYTKDLDFVQAQVFTIDYFLRFMAEHGYTLQKVRTKNTEEPIFCDIYNTIKKYSDQQKEEFFKHLQERKNQ